MDNLRRWDIKKLKTFSRPSKNGFLENQYDFKVHHGEWEYDLGDFVAESSFTELIEQAKDGDENALYQVGAFYEYVKKDYKECLKWYRASASKGYGRALYSIGEFYLGKIGGKANHEKALEFFLSAEEKGNSDAMWQVYFMYAAGQGVEQNREKAKYWLEKYRMAVK